MKWLNGCTLCNIGITEEIESKKAEGLSVREACRIMSEQAINEYPELDDEFGADRIRLRYNRQMDLAKKVERIVPVEIVKKAVLDDIAKEIDDGDYAPEVAKEIQKAIKNVKKKKTEEKKKDEKVKRETYTASLDIRRGDFADVLSDVYNIDAIITDPPYPKEYLDCYSELAKYASTHLKEDGFCVAYSGQYNLPEVIDRMSVYLEYVWAFCLYHAGKTQLVNGVNIMCGWKPVLIFSRGRKKMRYSAYDVVTSEASEKHSHEWQQSESGVAGLIEIFSEPGQLVVDPFSGSGTFGKVCVDMSRDFIGAEIGDKKT